MLKTYTLLESATKRTHFLSLPLSLSLTLTLKGLQRGDVSGAQPGGVAAQDSLQVVGGVAK